MTDINPYYNPEYDPDWEEVDVDDSPHNPKISLVERNELLGLLYDGGNIPLHILKI